MVLTPHVRRAVRIPLLAAGGIATGRGMLAAFALGAEGVQLGTGFALTRESSRPAGSSEAVPLARRGRRHLAEEVRPDTAWCAQRLLPGRGGGRAGCDGRRAFGGCSGTGRQKAEVLRATLGRRTGDRTGSLAAPRPAPGRGRSSGRSSALNTTRRRWTRAATRISSASSNAPDTGATRVSSLRRCPFRACRPASDSPRSGDDTKYSPLAADHLDQRNSRRDTIIMTSASGSTMSLSVCPLSSMLNDSCSVSVEGVHAPRRPVPAGWPCR